MVPLNQFYRISISKNFVSVSQPTLSVGMILTGEALFPERLRYFTGSSMADLATLLAGGTSAKAYIAAEGYFGADIAPVRIAVGHRGSSLAATFAGTLTSGSISAKVNGSIITTTFATDKATTLGNFATAISAVTGIGTASYTDNVLTIPPDAGYVIGLTDLVITKGNSDTLALASIAATESEDVADALNAIQLYQPDWYCFGMVSTTESEVLEAATWANAEKYKLFATRSNDATNLANKTPAEDAALGSSGSIAARMKNVYSKSFGVMLLNNSTQFPEIAAFGKFLPLTPGKWDLMAMSLNGVTPDTLTPTQRYNVVGDRIDGNYGKNWNVYEAGATKNIIYDGITCSNEYVSTIVGLDWLDITLHSEIAALRESQDKIPMTKTGVMQYSQVVERVLKTAQDMGIISETHFDTNKKQDGGFYIETPDFSNLSALDKAAGVLRGIKFTAYLANSINYVVITGVVQY